MAYKISEECIACGTCIDECPVDAISEGDIYVINPDTCNECEDQDDGQLCVNVCQVDCIGLLTANGSSLKYYKEKCSIEWC